MKKLTAILALLLIATTCFVLGCAGETHEYGALVAQTNATCAKTGLKAHYKCIDCNKYLDENKNEVEYEDLIIAIDSEAHEYDTQSPIELLHSVCVNCYDGATVAMTSQEVHTAISGASRDLVIYLKAGSYNSIIINHEVENIVFVGGNDTKVSTLNIAKGSNIILSNITFTGISEQNGICVSTALVDGLTLYDCKFTNTSNITGDNIGVVKNLALYNCEFNISGTNASAIKIYGIDGLTLKDNTFTNVPYNVIQLGEANSVNGDIVITGNKFIHVGSRMLYFVKVGEITSCNISGNYFNDNSTYCNKSTGCYMKIGGTGITIGANYWEEIPELTEVFFECADLNAIGLIIADQEYIPE